MILDYIREKHPDQMPLYEEIYQKGSRMYWEALDEKVRAHCENAGLEYVRDDDSMKKPFETPPVVVNFFYHEEIKKSAKKQKR